MSDPHAAHAHSAYFRRTLAAFETRDPALLERLPALVERPLTPEAVASLWSSVSQQRPADADPGPDLRRVRQLLMLAIIERDVRQLAPLEEVCAAISAWAEMSVEAALRWTASQLAQLHGEPLDDEGRPQDLLVVGMGKLGGRELNVSSDIDLVFVHRGHGETRGRDDGRGRISSSEFFHRLARRLSGLLSDVTEHGFVFRVDTRLRPNGDSGPLVATLPMLEQYFFDQGREWERFAWLKGRVIADSGLAGDEARGDDERHLVQIVEPFVFRRYLDFAAFSALRDLHRLIREEVDRREARRSAGIDVKLGRGGIREVEFSAQLFQIVRGGRDPSLRDRRTLPTIALLAERRLIDPQAAGQLTEAYRLLRRVEHALQYQEDAQTHRLPADAAAHARIAAMLGFETAEFEQRLERARDDVAAIFGELLATPDESDADARAARPAHEPDEATRARIIAMRDGRRYRTARPDTQRTIDQLLEQALAEPLGDAPEQTIGRVIDLLETVAGRPAYLALLAQYPPAYRHLLRMVSQAKWAAHYLTRHPVVLDELLDGQLLEPPEFDDWERHLRLSLGHALRDGEPDFERQLDILREAHHAQVFKLLAQDLAGRLTVERLSDHLSELADRVLAIALDAAWAQLRTRHRERPAFAVIGYGKLGGKELGYASDLDLVFLFEDPDERAQPVYSQLAQRLSAWLSTRTAAGLLFEIDLRLRPNGAAGLLVSSLNSFDAYQRESAWVWEHQALTRARFCAGDAAIGERFEAIRRSVLGAGRDRDELRQQVIEMRRKMLDGHPNRSELFDIKHDPGGMVDIEFIVQYLVLAHACERPELLDNAGNIALLLRSGSAGLVDATLAERVAQAYRDYRRMQHTLRLNEARYARVPPAEVGEQRDAVLALRTQVLGA